MKKLTYTLTAFLLTTSLLSQTITMQLRGGYDTQHDIVISPAVSFMAHGFAITPELIAHYRDDVAQEAGIKLSYQYKGFEAGYGRYAVVHSMDKGTELHSRNGWGNNFFVQYGGKVLNQNFFVQAEHLKTFRLTIGVKGLIN